MKIAITGAHGVGKTTLLNEINYQPKITEVAREIIDQLGNPKHFNKKELNAFQYAIVYKQLFKEAKNDSFISDRSLIDALAYTKELYVFEDLYEVVKENINYDLVFYIPIEFELEKDNVRFDDVLYQKYIDNVILDLLDEFNIKYIEISGNLKERIEKLNLYLK